MLRSQPRAARRLAFFALTMVFAIFGAHGHAANRIALVIGNGAYEHVSPLLNPTSDGALMAETLAGLGFEVDLVIDADQMAMKRRIVDFGRKLRRSGADTVGLFYYAGHGIQSDGRNFLIPVEASLTDDADLDLMGVEANWVLRQMESAGNHTNIVILDACRNNPFASTTRSTARGLARLDAPTGSFIAYATAPGNTAEDGDGANSPFTSALAAAMTTPGKPIEQVFKQVRVNVISATGGKQTPWDSSSLVDDFYFAAAPAAAPVTPAEESLWQSVSESGDPNRIALFLQVFPNSQFAPEAKVLLMEAMTEEKAQAAPTPNPAPAASQHDLIAAAQKSRLAEDYQAYLDAYPNGVFADLARAEMKHSMADEKIAAVAPAEAAPDSAETDGIWTFDSRLKDGGPELIGRSLRDLSRSSPHFPPIPELPEALWSDQSCSNCHNWSSENLCDQGAFYGAQTADALLRTPHPFGGYYKEALAAWAADGCS